MDIDPSQSEALRQKSEALRALSTGPISSSVSKLSGSSRVLPSEKDFHFYYNFDEFRSQIDEIGSKSQSMLRQIGSSKHLWGGKEMGFPRDVDEDACDWLVNVNDEVIELFDMSVDEFSTLKKKKVLGVIIGQVGEKEENVSSPPAVRVVERDKKTLGPKPKVPFHIPTIKRPQDEYNILVNNANQPFQHVWLEKSEDGSRVIHPLEKLSVVDFVDKDIESLKPVKPPPLESTPFKLVEEVKGLKELAAKLRSVNEFAVDLEHNQYRSFQGLTCLMQVSTRTEDFVVDTLKLKIHVGPYLREIFKDPTKKKVMHGADSDIAWLQRDFGIYVCNLFDTGQASRVLQMERNSLAYLLQHFCGVTANKEYQNADWRLRPLPDEMMRYAREDTHYLLYIYDLMKIRLLSESKDPENSDVLLLEVYKRSYDICMQLYEKELLTETSYLHIYGVQGANLDAQQLSIVSALYEWRDTVARVEDESTGYILPNKTLMEIAKQMPLTTGKLRKLLRSKLPYVERNLSSVVDIIRHSVQNASSFAAVVEQLKESRIQAPQVDDAGADFPEVHTAGGGVSFDDIDKNEKMKDSNGSVFAEFRRDCFSFPSQKREINVAEATVQVLKKPNRAFGALLGSFASRKKTGFIKERGEGKLEQIKSSVNLPFYSFSHRDQLSNQSSKQAPEEPNSLSETYPAAPSLCTDSEDIILLDSDRPSNQACEEESRTLDTPLPEDRVSAPADIILLDGDSDDEALPNSSAGNDNNVDTIDHPETSMAEVVVLDDDDDDDDDDGGGGGGGHDQMSLSDLSSSFQNCVQSTDQIQTTEQDGTAKR